MSNIEVPHHHLASQLLTELEKDQKYIIELREASNVFLEISGKLAQKAVKLSNKKILNSTSGPKS